MAETKKTNGVPCTANGVKKPKVVAGQKGKIFEGNRFYKPFRVDPKEYEFYSNLSSTIPALVDLVPKFYGKTTRENDPTEYIVLHNVFSDYRKAGVLDIKVGLPTTAQAPLQRRGVANLLGCYVHGVDCKGLVYHNKFNDYDGKQVTADHFDATIRSFFEKMGRDQQHIKDRLHNLISVIESCKGWRWSSASVLILFEDDDSLRDASGKQAAQLYLIDFERALFNPNDLTCDESVVRSLKHVLYALRGELDTTPVPTVYFVRHGERHDYTDESWAPKSTHPHDAPLSAAGFTQADDLVDRLCVTKPRIIACSPFQRAIQTAIPLARQLGCKIAVEPGLAEFLCNKTRKRVPEFFSDDVSISPWVDTEYQPFWPKLELETWESMHIRSRKTFDHLWQLCKGKGDLIICSHRSTIQSLIAEVVPSWTLKNDTKLEYGGLAMVVEDIESGLWSMQTWNELAYLSNLVASPSSNPWRHIEGYYVDMDWTVYKSTATLTSPYKSADEEKKKEELPCVISPSGKVKPKANDLFIHGNGVSHLL